MQIKGEAVRGVAMFCHFARLHCSWKEIIQQIKSKLYTILIDFIEVVWGYTVFDHASEGISLPSSTCHHGKHSHISLAFQSLTLDLTRFRRHRREHLEHCSKWSGSKKHQMVVWCFTSSLRSNDFIISQLKKSLKNRFSSAIFAPQELQDRRMQRQLLHELEFLRQVFEAEGWEMAFVMSCLYRQKCRWWMLSTNSYGIPALWFLVCFNII